MHPNETASKEESDIDSYCFHYRLPKIHGPRREKPCLWRIANDKGADQPAHPRSLFSAFVIRVLVSTISKLETNESSIF